MNLQSKRRPSRTGLHLSAAAHAKGAVASSRRLLGAGEGGGTASNHYKPLCATSACDRVKSSWSIISSDLENVGVDFLIPFFMENPDLLNMFPFSPEADDLDALKRNPAKLRDTIRQSKIIKAHARLVMREVGRCVAGLYDLSTLVPRLRSLGRMHGAAGVQPGMYDVFFKHLFAAVKIRLDKEGAWTAETAEAWLMVADSIGSVMKRTDGAAAEIEELGLWGHIGAATSLYICFVTPLQLAGILRFRSSYLDGWAQYVLNLLDFVAALVFATELLSCALIRKIKIADVREAKMTASTRGSRRMSLTKSFVAETKSTAILGIRRLGVHGAATWPTTDALVLLSYALQLSEPVWSYIHGLCFPVEDEIFSEDMTGHRIPFISMLFKRSRHDEDMTGDDQSTIIGMHWTRALGLIRLVVIIRAIYALRSATTAYTIKERADHSLRTTIRICRLVLSLCYASHLVACCYCLVARVQLGPECRSAESTAFFPDVSMLGDDHSFFVNYIKAIHFAWVNLAGIGNHESVPSTALETLFTLAVNAVGATLYAMTTGQVVAIMEPASEKANILSDEAAVLTDYMIDVGMDAEDQERIMRGYFLRNMIGDGEGEGSSGGDGGPYAAAPGLNASAPDYPQDAVERLPRHLKEVLRVAALADAMSRRDRTFRRCSDEFLSSLVTALRAKKILLPGDYIVRQGEETPDELLVVEQGTLEVIVAGKNVRTFERGDMVSYHWITSRSSLDEGLEEEEKEKKSECAPSRPLSTRTYGSFSPLLLGESVAGASVRAMDYCQLATGLSTPYEVKEMKRRYAWDFTELEEALDNARHARQNVKKLARAVNAVSAFSRHA